MSGQIKGCAIDVDHLASQTMHDDALRREILAMFVEQLREAQGALAGLAPQGRRDLAHRLKGTANAVGAFELGQAASALMETPGEASLKQFETAAGAALHDAQLLLRAGVLTSEG